MRAFLRVVALLLAFPLVVGGGFCLAFGGVVGGLGALILFFLAMGAVLSLFAFGVIGGPKHPSESNEDR